MACLPGEGARSGPGTRPARGCRPRRLDPRPSGTPWFPCQDDRVDTFAEIADERRSLAALVSGLTGAQQATQSLCSEWSVRDVVAHLVVPLEVSTPKFVVAMLACRGNFDRA